VAVNEPKPDVARVVAIFAHDVRTPLTVIKSQVQLARTRAVIAPELAVLLIEEVHRIDALVSGLERALPP
jgi:signal transduction histidine kinase